MGKKLDKAIAKGRKKLTEKPEPLWKGPEDSGEQGGVTQSLLCDFLVDRERFRIKTIEGLRSFDKFEHKLEFGSMWHACEEAVAGKGSWKKALLDYSEKLSGRYPMARKDINKWVQTILIQFPVYLDYWSKEKTTKKQLLQEQVFHVPYSLPSGRTVYLRGKWDGVSLETLKGEEGIYLDEHKTKGDIDELKIRRQLRFDIQTMIYLVALVLYARNNFLRDLARKKGAGSSVPILGVDYNVIRRPWSGGKGSIRQHKPTKSNPLGESETAFYNRFANDYLKKEPGEWFMRWRVQVSPEDIGKFKTKFLTPILEQLCDWYTWQCYAPNPFDTEYRIEFKNEKDPNYTRTIDHSIHWQSPYIFNPISEGYSTDLDGYIDTGNQTGLERVETLFQELEE